MLLEICRASEDDPEVTAELRARLRSVPALMGEPYARRGHRLELALALLTAVLGRLRRYNPTHLPFGYAGPTIRSHNWVEREGLERVGKQIAGLMWPTLSAETVAVAIEQAVCEAVRLGFLEQQQYDAWRPGMPSGSGWRKAVAMTPYGMLKAESAMPESVADASGTHATEPLPEPPQTEARHDGPAVEPGRRGEACRVLGKKKKPLTDAQYAVVSALIAAGEEGMSKDALEQVRPSARRILKRLREDPDWAAVILMPGQTNGRYRIRL